jgi:predicted PurR-regulated permease PerM
MNFKEQTLYITKIVLIVIGSLVVLYFGFKILLMIFAALLVALFFRSFADFISKKTNLSDRWSLSIVMVGSLLLTVGLSYLIAPQISSQMDQLTSSIPLALSKIQHWLGKYSWGQQLLNNLNAETLISTDTGKAFVKASGAISGVLGWILDGLIIFLIGLYLAISPQTYFEGLIKLFPPVRRNRLREVAYDILSTLRWWLLGRFVDMAFVGFLVWLGLFFLDVPLAFTLALIASITNFIPNIGPFLGAIPAILVGVSADPGNVIGIITLFVIVQSLESVFITPMVQQKAIHLPPALTITCQILFGANFGTIGLAVATPIVATTIVIIKELYIKDTLKDYSSDI